MQGSDFAALLWVCVSVIAILLFAGWATRYLAGMTQAGRLGGAAGQRMKVLDRLPLGKDQTLLVVQAGDRFFLLGVSAGGMTTLAELTQEEAAQWSGPPQAPEEGGRSGFRETLLTAIQQKGRR